jgi:hypothetical protein
MNLRKEYILQNGNLGDKILDSVSYVPILGLPLDKVLNKRVGEYLKTVYSGEELNIRLDNLERKIIAKDSYHFFSSLAISVLLLQRLISNENRLPQEKLEGPDSLENVIKVIGKNNNSEKTFNYLDYFG